MKKDQRTLKMTGKVCLPGSKSGSTVLAIDNSLNGCEVQPVDHDDSIFQLRSLQHHSEITYVQELF